MRHGGGNDAVQIADHPLLLLVGHLFHPGKLLWIVIRCWKGDQLLRTNLGQHRKVFPANIFNANLLTHFSASCAPVSVAISTQVFFPSALTWAPDQVGDWPSNSMSSFSIFPPASTGLSSHLISW